MNKGNFKHGHSPHDGASPTYRSWKAMRARCGKRENYTAITVTPEWDDYINFLRDMGERPQGTTIERRDNNRGYSKDNCCWATPADQTRNRSISIYIMFRGERLRISEIAERTGKSWKAIYHKHKNGTLQDFLNGVKRRQNRGNSPKINGELLSEISDRLDLDLEVARDRLSRGKLIVDGKIAVRDPKIIIKKSSA